MKGVAEASLYTMMKSSTATATRPKKSAKAEAVREAGLDKFYTLPSVANQCIERLGSLYPWGHWDLVVEPSAGNGSFFLQLPVAEEKKVGLDIAPEHAAIQAMDFFQWGPPVKAGERRILVVGNPPFGRVSSLAMKFFNHAATWATAIAFIVPRTFRRVSVQNKLNREFHLEHDEDVPTEPCSFDPPMMAKCCFQVWAKRATGEQRPLVELPTVHDDWDFLANGPLDASGQPTPPAGADFALRAYGGRCGDIVQGAEALAALRPKSWHWIRARIPVPTLLERFRGLDYSVSRDTARQNSIGRGELVRLYSEAQEAN